jgi:predicted nucleic acid-binding Zn ribbon protein
MAQGGGFSSRRGPRPVGEALGDLLARRGLGRLHARAELEAAWSSAVGPEIARRTRPGAVRRGVLAVAVAHPALLQELAAFEKARLLADLGRSLPAAGIRDLRFRVEPIE